MGTKHNSGKDGNRGQSSGSCQQRSFPWASQPNSSPLPPMRSAWNLPATSAPGMAEMADGAQAVLRSEIQTQRPREEANNDAQAFFFGVISSPAAALPLYFAHL